MTARAPLFDVQTLATHDGPGLRTVVFLKGCPLRCTWCSNPEGQSPAPSLRWHEQRCRRCLSCQRACPRGAVSAALEACPRIDRACCTGCAERPCIAACPAGALDMVGRSWEADELFHWVKRDLRLFWNSGGGITFSGGEPLLYPQFVSELEARFAQLGVGAVIETAGHWQWNEVADAIAGCERIYFDVKTLDDELHQRVTGCSNRGVLANLALLQQHHAQKLCVSLPLIPGVLDTLARIAQLGRYLRCLGIQRTRLLSYHRLGEGKYAALGLPLPREPGAKELPGALLEEARAELGALGLDVSLED